MNSDTLIVKAIANDLYNQNHKILIGYELDHYVIRYDGMRIATLHNFKEHFVYLEHNPFVASSSDLHEQRFSKSDPNLVEELRELIERSHSPLAEPS